MTFADKHGIKSGKFGDVINGVSIRESNRATVYEDRRAGLEHLLNILHNNYLNKGVKAALYGIGTPAAYAVFVESGFLTHIEEED